MNDSEFSGNGESSSDCISDDFDLKQAYDELKLENCSLKKQFEMAMAISSQFDDLQQKNQDLSAQLREEISTKNELENRCNLLLESNKELTETISKFKTGQNEFSTIKNVKQNEMIEKIKEKYEKQISNLQNQIQELQNQTQKHIISLKMNDSVTEKILLSAKRIYNNQFSSLTELSQFMDSLDSNFLTKEIVPVQQPEQQLSPNVRTLRGEIDQEKAIDIVKQKMKKQKEKMKILLSENSRLHLLLEKKDGIIKNLSTDQKQDFKRLQRELQHKTEEFDLKETNYQKTIESLTQRNDALKSDLSKLKRESIATKEVIMIQDPPSQQDSGLSKSPKRSPDAIQIMQDQYIARINDLQDQLNAQKQKRDELFEQMRKSQSKINELQILSSKTEQSSQENEKLYQEALSELKAAREDLQNYDDLLQKNENYKERLKEMKLMLSQLNKQVHEQSMQIKENEVEFKRRDNMITEKAQEIARLNEENEKLFDEISSFKSQILVLTDENTRLKEPKEIEIPSYVYSSLPSVILPKLDSINSNKMMQMPTKVQNMLKITSTYYSQKLNELENLTSQNELKLKESVDKLFDFASNVSILTLEEPLPSIDAITNPESTTSQQILDVIADIKNQLGESMIYSEALSKIVEKFNDTLGCNEGDINQMIDDLTDSFQRKAETISRKSKKNKELKHRLLDLENAKKQESEELQEEINELQNEIAEIKENSKKLAQEKQDLLLAQSRLENENKDLKAELDDTKKLMANDNELFKEEYEKQKQRLENAYKQHFNQLKKQIETKNSEIENKNAQEERLKNYINKQTSQIQELEKQKSDLEEQMKQKVLQLEKQNETEKKNLKDIHDGTVTKLKQQLFDIRNDAEELSAELASKNQINTKLQQKLDKTNSKLRTAERKVVSLEEQMHREQMLLESAKKAQIVMQESQVAEKISKVKQQYETENRNLYLYIIDLFKQYFCSTDKIDYSSIRRVLKMAASELHRLEKAEKSIKSLLDANEHQSLEDVVSQFYYNSMEL